MTTNYEGRDEASGRQLLDWIQELAPGLIPHRNPDYPDRNVVVLGSFKGWYSSIKSYRERLRAAGFWPVAPQGEDVVRYAGSTGTFEVLDHDVATIQIMENLLERRLTPRKIYRLLEGLFQRAIRDASDLVYVVGLPRDSIDDGNYIGLQVSYELGLALASGPVYGTEISPTLDERDGYDSFFAGHVAMIDIVTPEDLGRIYEQKAAT